MVYYFFFGVLPLEVDESRDTMQKPVIAVGVMSIIFLTMYCSNEESIDNLLGRTQIPSSIDTLWYTVQHDSFQMQLFVIISQLIWVNEFPAGGNSSVSIIISGESQVDLEVETYTASVPAVVRLARDSNGIFSDTVLIAVSSRSGLLINRSSRLFVKNNDQALDTIDLINPRHNVSSVSFINP